MEYVKKFRVLQINAVKDVSSTGRTTSELHNWLKNNDIESHVAHSIPSKEGNNYLVGNILDRKIHALLSRILGLQGYFSIFATLKLIKHIHTIKPDIIHLRNLHGNYINLPLLLKYISKKDIATVITLHDCWFYTGKCTHYTLDKCYRWKKECYKCPRLKKDNPSWFFDFTKKQHNDKKKLLCKIPRLAVIGVSDWVTKEASQSFLSCASQIKTIYNWIDIEKFQETSSVDIRKKYDLPPENNYLIAVASFWDDRKGINLIIELSRILSLDQKILLVGNCNIDLKKHRNIYPLGDILSTVELASLYTLSLAMINCSKEETFGKVTAEAMSCGTPVIAYNSTANTELVNEETGILLEREATASNFHAAIEVIKSKGKDSYKSNCRKFVINNFSYEHQARKYYNTYKTLLRATYES